MIIFPLIKKFQQFSSFSFTCIAININLEEVIQVQFIEFLNQLLWGRLMPVLLIGIGIYLSIRSGFFQFRKFFCMLKNTVGKVFTSKREKRNGGLSVWESISTALASTVGTGSIIGIALAIREGGAGAVFWMWVSALIGSIIKYAEIVLALRYRRKDRAGFWVGGPMYYLRDGLNSRVLSFVFAIFCLCTCFGIGNSVQANAISSVLKSQLHVDSKVTGVVLALLVAVIIFGGLKKIASFNAKLVPVMSIFYIACCLGILLIRWKSLPFVFIKIFKEAFSLPAALGGVSSYGFVLAMKNGFSKGIFSNEAGLGSAPIAHASCESEDFEEQGLWGMFEVFFTTVVICTMTALVILSSDLQNFTSFSGTDLAVYAFESSVPIIGSFCLVLSIVLFSFSTILGWAFYGEVCLNFLSKNSKRYLWIFRLLLIITLYLGATGELSRIWTVAELLNGFMAIPNLIGVLFLSEKVFSLTKDHF